MDTRHNSLITILSIAIVVVFLSIIGVLYYNISTIGPALEETPLGTILDPILPDLPEPEEQLPDADNDGILDSEDNCPFYFNPTQLDTNGNGIGDVCDIIPPGQITPAGGGGGGSGGGSGGSDDDTEEENEQPAEATSCIFTDFFWSETQIYNGETVQLAVLADNPDCTSEEVTFTIFFNEGPGISEITQLGPVFFQEIGDDVWVAYTSWISEIPTPLFSPGGQTSFFFLSTFFLILFIFFVIKSVQSKKIEHSLFALLLLLLFCFGILLYSIQTVQLAPPDSYEHFFEATLVSDTSITNTSDLLIVLPDPPACSDGLDNDADGAIDWPHDFACSDPDDEDEGDIITQCQDGEDNDNDGLFDLEDPDCFDNQDNNEASPPEAISLCNNNFDEDGDGRIDYGHQDTNDPDCSSEFDTEHVGDFDFIYFDQFPEFNLHPDLIAGWQAIPFPEGTSEEDMRKPLNHGFSHLFRKGELEDQINIPIENRVHIWFGPYKPGNTHDGGEDPPWEQIRSPWDNDIEGIYKPFWRDRMASFANNYPESQGQPYPAIDLIDLDHEGHISPANPEWILSIKGDSLIPDEINALDDDAFVDRYKRDMSYISSEFITHVKHNLSEGGFQGRIQSYNNIVVRPRWYNLNEPEDPPWEYWTDDWNAVHYIVLNNSNDGDGFYTELGPYYENLEFITPSNYWFFEYPNTNGILNKSSNLNGWNKAARYLGYQLTLIEANRIWINRSGDDKGIVVWHNADSYIAVSQGKPVRPHINYAQPIFAFMSGAQGVMLWGVYDDPLSPIFTEPPSRYFEAYHHYMQGLHDLSQYNEFFDDGNTFFAAENPRNLSVNNLPVWRGVVHPNGVQMLVAAHNPFAEPHLYTQFDLTDPDGIALDTIYVQGLDTYLGICDLVTRECDQPDLPECSDEIDNDYDSLVDAEDPGCWTDPTNPDTYDANDDGEFTTATCEDADFTDDDVVDNADLSILLDNFGSCPDYPVACIGNLNGDAMVDTVDQSILIDLFGPCPEGGGS